MLRGNIGLQLFIIVKTVNGSSAMAIYCQLWHTQDRLWVMGTLFIQPIFIKALLCADTVLGFKGVFVVVFCFKTDKILPPPPQHGAYVLGFHRKTDHIATKNK